eukprot:7388239-Prymnesium_polylepis.2
MHGTVRWAPCCLLRDGRTALVSYRRTKLLRSRAERHARSCRHDIQPQRLAHIEEWRERRERLEFVLVVQILNLHTDGTASGLCPLAWRTARALRGDARVRDGALERLDVFDRLLADFHLQLLLAQIKLHNPA